MYKNTEASASQYTNCNPKEWEPTEIEFPGGTHRAHLQTHSCLTVRITVIAFTLFLRLPYCSIADCVDISFVECKPKLSHRHYNRSCQLVNSIAHNMGCADNCSTEVTTVKSQKRPWSTDNYVTMLTDAMLSLDILQYYPITNCMYFEGPLLHNSRTLHTISGPSMQFKDLKYNSRTLHTISRTSMQFKELKYNSRTLHKISGPLMQFKDLK